MISYTDLFGGQRAKLVPAQAIADMQKDGAGFAGFATWLDMTPAHPDIFALPDPTAVIQLPWRTDVAWVAADCTMEGKPVEQAPRVVLKKLVAEAARQGLRVKTGVEADSFSSRRTARRSPTRTIVAEKPCYDQQALMRRYDVITEICDAMLELGWKPYQNDHEDANGQFEMNWEYDDALATADKHSFFKFMVKSVAEKHGLRATFMPKPFPSLTGNGCHAHVSVWDATAKPTLSPTTSAPAGLSRAGLHFLGGIMKHATALAAITNPTVNSYKRINAPRTLSGRDLVAQHGHLDGQQPHPHGARSGAGPVRAAAARWRGQSLSAAGGHHRGRPRRHSAARPTRAGRSTSTCITKAIRSRTPRSCRSTCSTLCAPTRRTPSFSR